MAQLIDGDGHSSGLVCVFVHFARGLSFFFFSFTSKYVYLRTYVSAYYRVYIIQARRSMLSADVSETGVFNVPFLKNLYCCRI